MLGIAVKGYPAKEDRGVPGCMNKEEPAKHEAGNGHNIFFAHR
jgi:hypothetical protein